MTDRAWAIGNLRKKIAPSDVFPQLANLQWSVCLHVVGSENTPPRFLSRGANWLSSNIIPLLSAAHAGFALSAAKPPPFDPPGGPPGEGGFSRNSEKDQAPGDLGRLGDLGGGFLGITFLIFEEPLFGDLFSMAT